MRKKTLLIISVIGITTALISQCSFFSRAGSFRENTGYTGSSKCLSCHESLHREITRQWKAGSHHMTMRSGGRENEIQADLKLISGLNQKEILAIIGSENERRVFIGIDFQIFPAEGFRLLHNWVIQSSISLIRF